MSIVPDPSRSEQDRPVQVEGAPDEEGISEADVAERLDEDPEEQENRRDPVQHPDETEEKLSPMSDPTKDITQEAIDATAATYPDQDSGMGVEDGLRAELRSRGQHELAEDGDRVSETARALEGGNPPTVGRHDGSVLE